MDHAPSQSGFLFRLALIIDGVYRAVAAHIARDRTAGPTIVLVCNEVRRRFFRFARLVELVQLGILPRTRLLAAGWTRASDPASERAPYTRLPRGKGFLVKMMQAAPWTVAVYASQMHYWMADPAVASFLDSYPQGRRILRPVWRLLSADPLPAALREPERELAEAQVDHLPAHQASMVERPNIEPARFDQALPERAVVDPGAPELPPTTVVSEVSDQSPAARDACRPAKGMFDGPMRETSAQVGPPGPRIPG